MQEFKEGDILVRIKQTHFKEDGDESDFHKEVAIGAKVTFVGYSGAYFSHKGVYLSDVEYTQCADDFVSASVHMPEQPNPPMTLTTRITSILSDRQGITAQVEAIQALVVEVSQNWIEIDPDMDLSGPEVLGFNGDEYCVGRLYKAINGCINLDNDDQVLTKVTHYQHLKPPAVGPLITTLNTD